MDTTGRLFARVPVVVEFVVASTVDDNERMIAGFVRQGQLSQLHPFHLPSPMTCLMLSKKDHPERGICMRLRLVKR